MYWILFCDVPNEKGGFEPFPLGLFPSFEAMERRVATSFFDVPDKKLWYVFLPSPDAFWIRCNDKYRGKCFVTPRK